LGPLFFPFCPCAHHDHARSSEFPPPPRSIDHDRSNRQTPYACMTRTMPEMLPSRPQLYIRTTRVNRSRQDSHLALLQSILPSQHKSPGQQVTKESRRVGDPAEASIGTKWVQGGRPRRKGKKQKNQTSKTTGEKKIKDARKKGEREKRTIRSSEVLSLMLLASLLDIVNCNNHFFDQQQQQHPHPMQMLARPQKPC